MPYSRALGADSPTLSADLRARAACGAGVPAARLGDIVIPAGRVSAVSRTISGRKARDVHLLLSDLITHAEIDRAAAATETMKLVSFWADVLKK